MRDSRFGNRVRVLSMIPFRSMKKKTKGQSFFPFFPRSFCSWQCVFGSSPHHEGRESIVICFVLIWSVHFLDLLILCSFFLASNTLYRLFLYGGNSIYMSTMTWQFLYLYTSTVEKAIFTTSFHGNPLIWHPYFFPGHWLSFMIWAVQPLGGRWLGP